MGLSSDQQKALVVSLKPKLTSAGLSTKLILYDHNWDDLDYARDILNDQNAYNAVDGTGFHCYGGNYWDPANLTDDFPDKNIYFTECTGHSGNDIWGPNTLRGFYISMVRGADRQSTVGSLILVSISLILKATNKKTLI